MAARHTKPEPVGGIVGERLRALREARGLRQWDLAQAAKCQPQQVSNAERGYRGASIRLVLAIAIADALGTSLDYLTGRSDNPDPTKRA